MGKFIATYNEIIDLNHSLEDKGLLFKLHLHDACGSQSFTIESTGDNRKDQLEAMELLIREYFQEKKVFVKFIDEGLGFLIIS